MEKLIQYLNGIHDILAKADLRHELQLPQIIVIGSQSVGKSSLLESIVGKEFLPRGKGIVTRRPFEIQLIQLADDNDQEWFELENRQNERFVKSDDIIRAIEIETEKICGKNKAVSNVPLRLKYNSKKVLDLIMIDLPGLTKIPVGEQPPDIEAKVLEIILPYVKNPNSLILAVSKAQDDLATSEGLKLARQVDPKGERTIGVITQLDLMEKGSDALNDLLNQTYPLQLGFVGVVMRSAQDQKRSIEEQLLAERKFFLDNERYRKHADQMGVKYLMMTLNLNLIKSVKRCLPYIRETIIGLVQSSEFDLQQFGEFQNIDTQEAKSYLMLSLISKFSHAYKNMLDGKYLGQMNVQELNGGSRVIHVFNEIFRKTIQRINPFDILKDDDIRTAIKNANGIRPNLFVPEGAFEILVKQQIKRLEQPSIECAHLVYEELRRVLNQISLSEIERFDNLNNRIFEVTESLLHKCLMQSNQMIRNLIDIELGYINTQHPDFVSGMELLKREDNLQDVQKNKNQERQNQQVILQQQKQGTDTEEKSLLNFWPFQNNKQNKVQYKKNKQTELFDSKLEMMNQKKRKQQQGMDIQESGTNIRQVYGEYYTISQNQILNARQPDRERTLPQVPSMIKISDKPTKRDQSETEIIKELIVSYFNVVKKNLNDTVPKTIITFLVQQSRGLCERELIGQLYRSETVDELLTENEYFAKQRSDTKKQLNILRHCLNLLNDLDTKF